MNQNKNLLAKIKVYVDVLNQLNENNQKKLDDKIKIQSKEINQLNFLKN